MLGKSLCCLLYRTYGNDSLDENIVLDLYGRIISYWQIVKYIYIDNDVITESSSHINITLYGWLYGENNGLICRYVPYDFITL